MTRFAVDTVSIHSVGMGAAVTLRGMSQAGHRLSRNTVGINSGNTYEEARFIVDVDDEFSFGGVVALKSLFDNVSALIGKCITDDGTHPGVEYYGQSLDRCGTKGRGAAGTHLKKTAKLAHILLSEFGGSKNQLASATLRVVNMLKTGDTRPTATVYNASLPATPVVEEAFKIGPVSLAGQVIDEDGMSVNVSTGMSVEVVKDTKGYAKTLLVLKTFPVIRVTLEDSAILDDAKIPYEGKAALHADTYVSFIALDPAGGNKSLAGLHHIKCTANGKIYLEDVASGGGPASTSNTAVIECTETSLGVAPLVITTGVAL